MMYRRATFAREGDLQARIEKAKAKATPAEIPTLESLAKRRWWSDLTYTQQDVILEIERRDASA